MNRLFIYKGFQQLISNPKNIFQKLHSSQSSPYLFNRTGISGNLKLTKPYSTQTKDAAGSELIKDVIVFKYENPNFYRMLNIFGLCQFFFWNYLAHFSFTTLRDAPGSTDEDAAWWQRINLGDNRYRNGITICCFLVGYGILGMGWMYTLRSIRYLILRKGGNEVSLVTYGPFGKNRIMNIPIRCISAQESRETATGLLALKVKNKSFFYILDMQGKFLNTRLYDYTVGLKRKL